jgi:Holliday junction DNA helicase RuvA
MIGYLEGVLVETTERSIILNVGGVGYLVYCLPETLLKFARREGSTIPLWTYLAVRETALDLYGFESKREKNFFELLLTVSGIGPRSALSVLNVSSVSTLESAIRSNDVAYLTKVSGIGRRTAEKIVIELKDKMGIASEGEQGELEDEALVIEALKSLGYIQGDIREALKLIPKETVGTSNRIKAALRQLGK